MSDSNSLIESDQYRLLLPPKAVLLQKVAEWIHEDIPSFDVGAAVVGDQVVEATLYYKPNSRDEICVLAGQPFVDVILKDSFGVELLAWM
jgi:nicotinate-nucleotide pyrophosphorylase (carboxylating)